MCFQLLYISVTQRRLIVIVVTGVYIFVCILYVVNFCMQIIIGGVLRLRCLYIENDAKLASYRG